MMWSACIMMALAALIAPARADESAEALLGRVKGFDAKRLPPHPRLVFSDANMVRLRQTIALPANRKPWQRLTEWVAAEAGKPAPDDPGPRRSYYTGPGGAIDIVRFRAMSEFSEAVENHVIVGAAVYRITGDAKALEVVRRWALAVAGWDPDGATSIQADDYAARQTLYSLAQAYDVLFAQWTAEERTAIRASMLKRAARIYDHLHPFKLDEYNNHPWYQCSAMLDAGLALADESADADQWWRYGAELYFTRFLPLWGQDGDWHEGISYTTFTMKYVAQSANSLQAATGINPFELPSLHRAGWFRFYAAPVGSNGIYFNDTRPLAKQNWDKPIAYRLAAEARDPVLQWYAEQLPVVEDMRPSASVYLLLYQDPKLRAEPPTAAVPLTRHFRDSGWVIARTDLASGKGVEFGFKSAPWVSTPLRPKGHDHPDANNFLLNYLGKPLLIGGGYYDFYNSPHHKGWTFTGKAHNTLLIDGQEQLIQRPGKIVTFESRAGQYDWMEGEGADSYPPDLLKSWRRQVLYLRPDLFVIRDVVRPVRPAAITLLLHGASPFEFTGQTFIERNGPAAVTGQIVTPADLQIKQWTGFPEGMMPERKKPSDLVEFPDQTHAEFTTPDKVAECTFITVFGPSTAGLPKSISATVASGKGGADVVTIRAGDAPPVVIQFAPTPEDASPTPAPQIRR